MEPLGMQQKTNRESRAHYGTYPEVRGQRRIRPESQDQYGMYPDQYTYFERRYVNDLSPYRLEYRPRHEPEWIPGVLQKPSNSSEFPPPQYYRSLPQDHHQYRRIPRRVEKEPKGGRHNQQNADTIYDQVDIAHRQGPAQSRKEVPGKLEKDQQRKKRKEPEEEAALSQSPKQFRKHRKKRHAIEQPLDAEVVYGDWESLYQIPQPHAERTLDTTRERAPGPVNRRREAPVHRPTLELSGKSQRRKMDPRVLQNSKYNLVYPEGSKEEEALYEDIGRSTRHEWLSGSAYMSDPWTYSWQERKQKHKRNFMRPPPYVPPPAYNAQHRTFTAPRPRSVWDQQPTTASLGDQTSLRPHARAQSQQVRNDQPEAREGQNHNACLPKMLSQNAAKPDTESNALLEGKKGKEAETEKKKKFDSKICTVLMGWKLTQGFGTWGGSSKREEAEVTSQTKKKAQPSQEKKVEDVYETIEWETGVPKSKYTPTQKSRSTSPSRPGSAGVKSGEGRAFCLVSNHIEETVPKAKSYTLPRAAHKQRWHDQDMCIGPVEQQILPTEGGKRKLIRGRHFGKVPEQQHLVLREEKNPHLPSFDYNDYEDIYPCLPVYQTPREEHWDKLPYELCYSFPPDQPQYLRNRTVFQELSSNTNVTKLMNQPMTNNHKHQRNENQGTVQDMDRKLAFYSQTLPRDKVSRGRVEAMENMIDRRRRSLESVAPLAHERSQGENSEEFMRSRLVTSFPRWSEPSNAKTLPRQRGVSQNPFDKVYQEFRATCESPKSKVNHRKGRFVYCEARPHIDQLPSHIEAQSVRPLSPPALQQESDGMFVIDATCVLIRAEYIFPPKTEQVKYLSPSWEGAGQQGQNVSSGKRDLGHGRGSEPSLYGQRTRENKPSLMSPTRKHILNKQHEQYQQEAGRGLNHGDVSTFQGSYVTDMNELCSASDTHLIQERASRILGLSLTELEPLIESRSDKIVDSQPIEEAHAKYSTETSNVLESLKDDVFSMQGERIRPCPQLPTSRCSFSRLSEQQAPRHPSSELGVRKKALFYESHFRQVQKSPESGEITQKGGSSAVKSNLSSEISDGNENVDKRYSRLQEYSGRDEQPLTKETSAEHREVYEESNCDNEKRLRLDELSQKYKHRYSDAEAPPTPTTLEADEKGCLDLDSGIWQNVPGAPVELAVIGKDGPVNNNLQKQISKASAQATHEWKESKQMPVMQIKVQEPPVADQPSLGNQEEGNKYFPHEDEHGPAYVLPKIQSNTSDSKGGQGGPAIKQLDFKDSSSEKCTLMKPSNKRRGFYAKDLREAVFRIRRHTAPDSDTDEEQEHKPLIGSKQKTELLQREQAPTADSSSSSNDSEATVIMRDDVNTKKELALGWECPTLGSPTEAVGRWLVSSGEHQEAAMIPNESKNSLDLDFDSSAPSLAATAEDHPGIADTSNTGHPDVGRKPGSDLGACIEEILQELSQAEIDFFGTSGEDVGCMTEASGQPAAEETLVHP